MEEHPWPPLGCSIPGLFFVLLSLKYAGNVLGGQREGLWNCKSQDCQSALPHHILDSEMSLGNLQVNVVQDEVKG